MIKPQDTDTSPRQATWHIAPNGQQPKLVMSGDWVLGKSGLSVPPFDDSHIPPASTSLVVDAQGVDRWDSSFVSFLWTAEQIAAHAGLRFDLSGAPKGVQRLFELLPDRPADVATHTVRRFRPVQQTGAFTLDALNEFGAVTELGIDMGRDAVKVPFGHVQMRLRDIVKLVIDAGPSALIIVSVVNFLVGAILAFVGAVQLQKFSADIYVANLVGIACVRELSAIMTAIIMAGRTGGAYAARIATMLGNEEIDALQVFGISLSSYLILPSVLALFLMMPLLYLYGCCMSILGGYIVATGMLPDITGAGYFHQTFSSVNFQQFEFGFIKTLVFACMIGLTSCRIGLTSGRSAADVGTSATRAVVVGIVGVIALDAIFAIIANVLDI